MTKAELDVLFLFMGDATEMRDRHAAILRELADMGLEIARDLKAKALAAEDEATSSALALSYHRLSRSIRQTLALEARLRRDHEQGQRDAAARRSHETFLRKHDKRKHLRKAVAALVWTEHEPDEAERILEPLETLLFDASEDEAFLDAPLETLVEQIRSDLLALAAASPDITLWQSSG